MNRDLLKRGLFKRGFLKRGLLKRGLLKRGSYDALSRDGARVTRVKAHFREGAHRGARPRKGILVTCGLARLTRVTRVTPIPLHPPGLPYELMTAARW